MIGNSINHQDNRLEHELNHRGLSLQDDDTASINSYGSHKNRPFKDESHKGSAETMEGEEKRDASKEDLGLDEELDEEGECEEGPLDGDIIIHANDEDILDEYPADCCPDSYYKKFPILAGDEDSPFWQGWGNLRLKTFQLIENKYFETAVITMILMSSLALVSQLQLQLLTKKKNRKKPKKSNTKFISIVFGDFQLLQTLWKRTKTILINPIKWITINTNTKKKSS